MRILLVEDEPDLGAALERTLKREKYVVDWVKNGIEAWQFLEMIRINIRLQFSTGCFQEFLASNYANA